MMYTMAAILQDGALIGLDQPEFVGEGLSTLADAIDAARDAMDYDSGIVSVRVYRGKGYFADYVGTYDAGGWHAVE